MIFVTGATGLVGSRIAHDLLKSGKEVRALRRASSDMDMTEKMFAFHNGGSTALFEKVEWLEGDLLDVMSIRDGVKACKEVYHAAAKVSFHYKDRDAMFEVNVKGTANVVDCCIEGGVERLCHISSVAALGRSSTRQKVDELSPWEETSETSTYAKTKYLSELEVWRGDQEGLKATIVNPVLVIGPTHPSDSSGQLFMEAMKGMRYYSPGTSAVVDVRDVSSMCIDLMRMQGPTERYLLSAETMDSQKLFGSITAALGTKSPTRSISPFLVNIAWRVLWLKDFLVGSKSNLTKETAASLFSRYDYSSKKVKERLNCQFISLEESLEEYCPFYLSLPTRS